MKNPLELVDFFIAFACINYSYMVQYDLDELKEKMETLRRKEIQSRTNLSLDL